MYAVAGDEVAFWLARGRKDGALFIRNSGTETKTCVTLRCTLELYSVLREAMLAVHAHNRELLKDRTSRDARIEAEILKLLETGPLPEEYARNAVERTLQETLAPTDFDAVLFAMRKEGVLAMEKGCARRLEEKGPTTSV